MQSVFKVWYILQSGMVMRIPNNLESPYDQWVVDIVKKWA